VILRHTSVCLTPISILEFEGQDFKQKQKPTIGIKWIAPPKRERKAQYSVCLSVLLILCRSFIVNATCSDDLSLSGLSL
jgi:hypothetical protein